MPIARSKGISVIIVSDHGAGTAKGREDIRAAAAALARQDFDEPAEFLLIESERFRSELSAELPLILPELKVHFVPDYTSYALKNEAVRIASGEFVAILDADSIPGPSWLRRLIAALRAHPQAAAVSGKTVYPEQAFSSRVCALLARAYLDPGYSGGTRFIAINNCAFRREAYLSQPLPTDIGTFASRIQSEALLRDGWDLWFDPEIQVTHDFEGWEMEADLRRNAGHGTVATRLKDTTLPWARLARLGPVSIPLMLAGKIFGSWQDCVRCWRPYGIRWFQLPAAMLISVAVHLLEVPGMLQAYDGRVLESSFFR